MPRHGHSFEGDVSSSVQDFKIHVSDVSYLTQFPKDECALSGAVRTQQFMIEPEPIRLPVAHMFSS